MNSKHLAAIALALAGTLAAGAAQARDRAEVQWSVSIGNPQFGVVLSTPSYGAPVYAPQYYEPQVYVPRVHAQPIYAAPVHIVPRHRPVHRAAWRDDDRDGIPNRYDRVYNPRWDRDGDGIPNRYERHHGHREARHGNDYRNDPRPAPNRDDRGGARPGR